MRLPGLAALLLCAQPAFAAQRLAVLETGGDPADVQFLKVISDATRQGVLDATKGSGVQVLEREKIAEILENNKCASEAGDCAISNARLLQADVVISSELAIVADSFIVTVKMNDVKSGVLIEQTQAVSRDRVALLKEVSTQTSNVARRGLKLSGKSGMAFGGGMEVRVPVIETNPSRGGGLKEINVRAEKAFEHAVDVQSDDRSSPEQKMAAWCELSLITDRNAYLQSSTQACSEWRKYVDELNQLRGRFPADWDNLSEYLDLKRPSRQEKLDAIEEFLQTYKSLDDKRKKRVRKVRAAIEHKEPAHLPKIAEMEVEEAQHAQARADQKRKDEELDARAEANRESARNRACLMFKPCDPFCYFQWVVCFPCQAYEMVKLLWTLITGSNCFLPGF